MLGEIRQKAGPFIRAGAGFCDQARIISIAATSTRVLHARIDGAVLSPAMPEVVADRVLMDLDRVTLSDRTVTAASRPAEVGRWLAWVLGAGLLVAVVTAALRFSEEEAFIRLARAAALSATLLFAV